MEPPRFKPRLIEVVVVVAGILVAVYAVWVIRNVGATTPDDNAAASPVEALSEASDEPSVAPTAPPRIGAVREAVADAPSVLVVGDSTGNDPGEWVDLWARDLALDREVRLHSWDVGSAQFGAEPTVYGTGRAMEIWNLSYPGAAADYAPKLQEVAAEPAAVIVNIGHDRSPQAIRRAIRTTSDAIDDRWGEVLMAWVLQNPSTGAAAPDQEDAVEFVRSLATTERVPVIDVHAQFLRADSLATLLVDDSRPNDRGSRLWADTVERALDSGTQ